MKDAIYIPDELWERFCNEIIATDFDIPHVGNTKAAVSTDRPTSAMIHHLLVAYLDLKDED